MVNDVPSRMSKTRVPESWRDGKECSSRGIQRRERVKSIITIVMWNDLPSLEVLQRKTTRIKFNRNMVINSKLSYINEIFDNIKSIKNIVHHTQLSILLSWIRTWWRHHYPPWRVCIVVGLFIIPGSEETRRPLLRRVVGVVGGTLTPIGDPLLLTIGRRSTKRARRRFWVRISDGAGFSRGQ